MLLQLLNTALPVFTALFIGVICRKKDVFSGQDIDALKKVAVDITLPFVLLKAFATADYSKGAMLIPFAVFLMCIAALLLGFLLKKAFRIDSALMPFLMTGFEAGMLGYGLFGLIFPGESNSAFAIIDLGQVLFVFTLYKGLLMGEKKEVVREIILSPIIWGIAAGLILGISGAYNALVPSGIAGLIGGTADFLSAPTSCLILITIGYNLELKNVSWKKTSAYVVLRAFVMGVMLIVMLALNNTVFGGEIHKGALILMLILPAPYVLPIFADAENERADIASALSVMTLLSLIIASVMSVMV